MLCNLKSVDEGDNDRYLGVFMCTGCFHAFARWKTLVVGRFAAALLKCHFQGM